MLHFPLWEIFVGSEAGLWGWAFTPCAEGRVGISAWGSSATCALPAPSHAALCLSLHPVSPTFLIPVLRCSVPPQLLLPCLIHPGLHVPLEPHSHPHLSLRPIPSPSWSLASLGPDASPSPPSCPKGPHLRPGSHPFCVYPGPHLLSQVR